MNALRMIRDAIRSASPRTWASLSPRQYQGAGGYDPAIPATSLGGAYLALVDGNANDSSTALTAMTANVLMRSGVPTWFAGKELTLSLDRTNPPEGVKWTDLNFPTSAGLILLPPGVCKTVGGRRYDYVTWLRIKPGDKSPDGKAYGNDGLVFTTASQDDPEFGGLVQSYGGEEWPHVKPIDEDARIDGTDPMSDDEANVMLRLSSLALNLILCALARPELLVKGEKIRAAKNGPGIYSPTWLGQHYTPQRDTTGTHASPRMHWRRGHFRQQAHGPEMSLRKVIWIEPVLVGE